MARQRIVITGMGAVTPLGHSVGELYGRQLEAASGVDFITGFDAATFPTKFAAQVKGYDLGAFLPKPERFGDCGANTRFALGAAKQALGDAGLLDWAGDRFEIGIYLGSGEGHHDFPELMLSMVDAADPETGHADPAKFCRAALGHMNGEREYELEMHTTTAHLAEEFDILGPNMTCLTACAASTQAIGEACDLIRRGDAKVMLSGGAHSMIHPLGVTGFNKLTALSTRNDDPKKASRPFDQNRDGFILGEGAGMVVLEDLEHAQARGATIHAEVTGYASTADAYRMTDAHEDGRGAITCMNIALKDAGLKPADIGYINAHGTSTQVNDRAETLAIKNVFGERAYKLPVSSSKSMLGHLIAAAGVVEAITAIRAIHQGVLPPTINYETPDPECDLDYVPNRAREVAPFDHALSNSFGFGGQNSTLILSRFRG